MNPLHRPNFRTLVVAAATTAGKRPTTNRPRVKGSVLVGGTPGRAVLPVCQSIRCPRCRFVRVADIARVRDLQVVGPRRIDEMEGMATDIHVGDRLFDLRHVAGDA